MVAATRRRAASMADRHLSQGPLANLQLALRAAAPALGETGVWMCERPLRGAINLRGPDDAAFDMAIRAVLGLEVPREPCRAVVDGEHSLLWLGPDEWLLLVPPRDLAAVQRRLLERLAGQHAAVVDVGDGRAAIGLGGRRARDLLSHATSLDLHPRAFGPSHCAQSLFARVPGLLHQLDDSPAFDLHVPRSFAEYLWTWLEAVAVEYGLAIVEG